MKRATWPLGRVTENFPGDNGVIHVVKVKTKYVLYPV